MILKLIAKDFKAHYATIFFKILLLWLSFGAFLMFRFYEWNVYMIHSLWCITFAGSIFLIKEKNRNTDILTCSLPVTKTDVVLARYIIFGLISAFGIVLWFAIAHIAHFLWPTSAVRVEEIFNIRVTFVAVFYLSLHGSMFLPAIFRFRMAGVIIVFSAVLTIDLCTTILIFRPDSAAFISGIVFRDVPTMIVLSSIIIITPLLSAWGSTAIYSRTDV